MGIRKRLVGSYVTVIALTVLILEIFLIISVRYYYLHNVERTLWNQAELSSSFFEQYFSSEDLASQSERLLKGFAHNSDAQVQILDPAGRILQDSNGSQETSSIIQYADIQKAIQGQPSSWRGQSLTTKENILAVSFPLQGNGNTVGVVRFVTSLTETLDTINRIALLLISVGLLVIVIVTVLGLLLSWTITRSIMDLKRAADQMSQGDFNIRLHKRYRDELGSLADTFNMMAGRILKSEQLKNDFISSVSHELRTPLTSIKGWVITLKSNGIDNNNSNSLLHDGLEIIESESDRLTAMVDELLDFSKMDNGRIVMHFGPVQLQELLLHIGKQLTPRATRQGVVLEIHADQHTPIIQADENRLKQVFINILDNSLKFTAPSGQIVVHSTTTSEHIIITIKDTGSGIAEADLDYVLQKFYKGNQYASGSGLGLAISHQIIQLHHGDLRITSTLGQGTTVEIYLPI